MRIAALAWISRQRAQSRQSAKSASLPEFGKGDQVIRLAHNEFGDRFHGSFPARPARLPSRNRGLLGKIGEPPKVVAQFGVATADDVPMGSGQTGLQANDAAGLLGVPSSGVPPYTSANMAAMHRIGTQNRRVLIVAVVGLVGQAEAGLVEVDEVPGRVLASVLT